MPNASLGSRQLHVLAVGFAPVVAPVDIMAKDTATVRVTVERVTLLSTMRVEQTRLGASFKQEFDARKKSGLGYYVDSAQIEPSTSLTGVLSGVPGVYVDGKRDNEASPYFRNPSALSGGAECLANIFIDGLRSDTAMLHLLRKEDVAAVEVYPRRRLRRRDICPRSRRAGRCSYGPSGRSASEAPVAASAQSAKVLRADTARS
jgi:hypothetical protein